MYYSYFYEQKLLRVVSIEKNAIDFTDASMLLSAQTSQVTYVTIVPRGNETLRRKR